MIRAVPDDRPILVCFAVREEATAFRKRVGETSSVAILIHGMGAANARRECLEALERHAPKWVITSGFAGALNSQLDVGAVLHEADAGFPCSAALERAGSKPGTFHCAERVAVTVAEKRSLRQETGCDAVDMESGIIRQLCQERRIPSATVRVVSDDARADLPLDFNRLMTADYRMDFLKLTGTLLRSPGKIGELMRFQKRLKSAAENLATVLAAVTSVE